MTTSGIEQTGQRSLRFALLNGLNMTNLGKRDKNVYGSIASLQALEDLVTDVGRSLDVDVTAFLPADTISHGFDNVADSQSFSPTLMEGYLRAASRVAGLAVGDPETAPTEATYKLPKTAGQMTRVEGAPLKSRLRHYTNLDQMAPKLRQLIHDFAWGRMDLLAHREAARVDAELTASAVP